MCEPTTVMMVMSAASAAASVASQKQQQKLQIQATENAADAAVLDYNYSQKNLENEAISQQDAVENGLFNQNIEAVKARSSVLAQSGSKGVAGQTVAATDQDINAQIGRQTSDINRNFDIYKQSAQSSSDANYRSLQSALTGMSGGVAGPGFLDSALKIGGAAYSGYNQGAAIDKQMNEGYVKP